MRATLSSSLALALGIFAFSGLANAASIDGSWSGGGTVRLKEGGVEKIRCRIKYEPGSGKTYVLYANCAHSNGTFKQSGRVVKRSGSLYTGRLYSDQYNVSGDLNITVSGKKQIINAKSPKGSARITLTKN